MNGTELLGVKWRLRSIVLDGRPIDNVAEAEAHLIFGADGKASGRGGCNLFFAGYKNKGGSVRFQAVASTKKYCEATMPVETAFFKALGAVTRLSVEDDVLKMVSKDGKAELVFARATQE
ncbi:MAG: META domain-containing protein [Methanomassiliicoccus sp.]|nr:META domain-containing protein [Methanomassiliicoccus sp.]